MMNGSGQQQQQHYLKQNGELNVKRSAEIKFGFFGSFGELAFCDKVEHYIRVFCEDPDEIPDLWLSSFSQKW